MYKSINTHLGKRERETNPTPSCWKKLEKFIDIRLKSSVSWPNIQRKFLFPLILCSQKHLMGRAGLLTSSRSYWNPRNELHQRRETSERVKKNKKIPILCFKAQCVLSHPECFESCCFNSWAYQEWMANCVCTVRTGHAREHIFLPDNNIPAHYQLGAVNGFKWSKL